MKLENKNLPTTVPSDATVVNKPKDAVQFGDAATAIVEELVNNLDVHGFRGKKIAFSNEGTIEKEETEILDPFRNLLSLNYKLSGEAYSFENPTGADILSEVGEDDVTISFVTADLDLPFIDLNTISLDELFPPAGSKFEDFYHEFNVPYDANRGAAAVPGAPWASVDFVYSYYDQKFEEKLSAQEFPELNIPPLYFYGLLINGNLSDDLLVNLGLGGPIPSPVPTLGLAAEFLERQVAEEEPAPIIKRRNLIFPVGTLKEMPEHNKKRHLYPASVEIAFKKSPEFYLAELFHRCGMTMALVRKDIEGRFTGTRPLKRFSEVTRSMVDDRALSARSFSTPFKDGWEELADFIADNYQYEPSQIVKDNSIIVRTAYDKQAQVLDLPSEFLARVMYTNVLKAKIEQVAKDNKRSAKDIFGGDMCYSEVLFYRIDKHFVQDNGNTGTPLQSFYVFNDETAEVSLVDTQVKYDTRYAYKIYAYRLVMGSEYVYGETRISANAPAEMDISVQTKIALIEAPHFEDDIHILDSPPVFPGAIFDSYRGQREKVLIRLSNNSGIFKAHPISLTEGDDFEIEKIRSSQEVPEGAQIEFSGDDLIRRYQVFRLPFEPSDWGDFSEGLRFDLDVENGTAVVDQVEPNADYYYTFRSVDVHGHFSNPSNIFKVRLNARGTAVSLDVETFDLPGARERTREGKSGRRFLMISPAFAQMMLNEAASGLAEAESAFGKVPTLGIREDGAFGKLFKVRCKSKNTGRAIDLNIRLVTTHISETE